MCHEVTWMYACGHQKTARYACMKWQREQNRRMEKDIHLMSVECGNCVHSRPVERLTKETSMNCSYCQ